jgi:hypothetical protein
MRAGVQLTGPDNLAVRCVQREIGKAVGGHQPSVADIVWRVQLDGGDAALCSLLGGVPLAGEHNLAIAGRGEIEHELCAATFKDKNSGHGFLSKIESYSVGTGRQKRRPVDFVTACCPAFASLAPKCFRKSRSVAKAVGLGLPQSCPARHRGVQPHEKSHH